jgi:hypothetical protein
VTVSEKPKDQKFRALLPVVIKNHATPGSGPTPIPTATPPPGSSRRIAIDPITRIEGHLRIEAQIENGRVTDAWSSGTMFRGLELILQGRDPRDA